MAGISVDHLRLHVYGLSRAEAERLAQLIAGRLVAAGASRSAGRRIETMRVEATGAPDAGMDRLAEQIASQVLAEVGRRS